MIDPLTKPQIEGLFTLASLDEGLRKAIAPANIIRGECETKLSSTVSIRCPSTQHLYNIYRQYDCFVSSEYLISSGVKEVVLTDPKGIVETIFINPTIRAQQMSAVETLSEEQVLAYLRRHEEDTGLPAACTAMSDSKPYLCSSNIKISTGLGLGKMLRLPSVLPGFPPDEFEKLRRSLEDAGGKMVEIKYRAAKQDQIGALDERQVAGRLIRLQRFGDDELFRLMFHTAEPRRLG